MEKPKRVQISVRQQWLGSPEYTADRGGGQFIKGKSLTINFVHGGKTYAVLMHASGSEWIGHYTVDGGRQESIKGKLYTAEDGSMLMVGWWFEEGSYTWIANIIPEDGE